MALRDRTATRTRRSISSVHYSIEPLEIRRLLSGSWSVVSSPVPAGDSAQMAMLLNDGSLMVHGGGGLNSSAWYRLKPNGTSYGTGAWSNLHAMSKARLFFASNVLPSGKVVVLGG